MICQSEGDINYLHGIYPWNPQSTRRSQYHRSPGIERGGRWSSMAYSLAGMKGLDNDWWWWWWWIYRWNECHIATILVEWLPISFTLCGTPVNCSKLLWVSLNYNKPYMPRCCMFKRPCNIMQCILKYFAACTYGWPLAHSYLWMKSLQFIPEKPCDSFFYNKHIIFDFFFFFW